MKYLVGLVLVTSGCIGVWSGSPYGRQTSGEKIRDRQVAPVKSSTEATVDSPTKTPKILGPI